MDDTVYHGVCLKHPCKQDVCCMRCVTVVEVYRRFVETFEFDKNA